LPLVWEAYYNLTMGANWLKPKAATDTALNIIQEVLESRVRKQAEAQRRAAGRTLAGKH
jgi:hypothetical protein